MARPAKRPRLGDELMARLAASVVGGESFGLPAGERSILDNQTIARKAATTDKHVREDGFMTDDRGNVINLVPFDDTYVEAWFSLQKLLDENPDFRAVTILAGFIGVQATELITDENLTRVERVERELRETLTAARKKYSMSANERASSVGAVQDALHYEMALADRLVAIHKAVRRTVHRWHWLTTWTGYPTTIETGTVITQKWNPAIHKGGTIPIAVPFWLLTRVIYPQYKKLYTSDTAAKMTLDDYNAAIATDKKYWCWEVSTWLTEFRAAFMKKLTPPTAVTPAAARQLTRDYLMLRDVIAADLIPLRPDKTCCPWTATLPTLMPLLPGVGVENMIRRVRQTLKYNTDNFLASSIYLDYDVFSPVANLHPTDPEKYDVFKTTSKVSILDKLDILLKKDGWDPDSEEDIFREIFSVQRDARFLGTAEFLLWLDYLKTTRHCTDAADSFVSKIMAAARTFKAPGPCALFPPGNLSYGMMSALLLLDFPEGFGVDMPLHSDATDSTLSMTFRITKKDKTSTDATIKLTFPGAVQARALLTAYWPTAADKDAVKKQLIVGRKAATFVGAVVWAGLFGHPIDLVQILEADYPSPQRNNTHPTHDSCTALLKDLGDLDGTHNIQAFYFFIRELIRSTFLGEHQFSAADALYSFEGDTHTTNTWTGLLPSIPTADRYVFQNQQYEKANYLLTRNEILKPFGKQSFFSIGMKDVEAGEMLSELERSLHSVLPGFGVLEIEEVQLNLPAPSLTGEANETRAAVNAAAIAQHFNAEFHRHLVAALGNDADVAADPASTTQVGFLRLLTAMCVFEGHFYPKVLPVQQGRIQNAQTVLDTANRRLADVITHNPMQDMKDIFNVMKTFYVPSRAWEMQVALTGRMRLQPFVVAAIAAAYSDVQTYVAHLRGVPCDVLTGYAWQAPVPPATGAPQPQTHAYADPATSDPPGAEGAVLHLATAFLRLVAAYVFDQRLSFPDQYKSTALFKRGPVLKQQGVQGLRGFRVTAAGGGGGKAWRVVAPSAGGQL